MACKFGRRSARARPAWSGGFGFTRLAPRTRFASRAADANPSWKTLKTLPELGRVPHRWEGGDVRTGRPRSQPLSIAQDRYGQQAPRVRGRRRSSRSLAGGPRHKHLPRRRCRRSAKGAWRGLVRARAPANSAPAAIAPTRQRRSAPSKRARRVAPQLQRWAVITHSVPIMPPALQLLRRLLTR